jgi:CheY-like chemotaxis protein
MELITLPVMDGLTAIKEIRAAEEAGTLRRNMVIALTGNARQGQIDQALAAGMDDGEWASSPVSSASSPRAIPGLESD